MQPVENAPHDIAARDADNGEYCSDCQIARQRNTNAEQRENENLRQQRHADAMAAETLEAVRENILGRTKDTNPYHATARMRVLSFMEAI